MRISQFSFKNEKKGWELLPVTFSDLTLLVGVSGVGKSQILKAIAAVGGIASGKNKPGYRWEITFKDESNRSCNWSGEFDVPDDEGNWLFEELELFASVEVIADTRGKSRI